MDKFTIYVTLVFIVKILFIILAISEQFIKHKKPNDKKVIEFISFWKERIEFTFKAMMSAMLIYLFNPRYDNMKLINYETKLLLYLFGFILIITANWNTFFIESPTFKELKHIVGQ
jgi:hypothetical protein